MLMQLYKQEILYSSIKCLDYHLVYLCNYGMKRENSWLEMLNLTQHICQIGG